ncbi:MAG: hypothetical protein GDA37_02295 [Ekhidna sp.]|nr:hypothetical protein [Ekhidna sp.]
MKKLGLDLGSSSIGWALKEDKEFLGKGVVTFKAGMSEGRSGGYSSPTKDRREARAKRNLIKARKQQKWELLKILTEKNFVPIEKYELEIWSRYKKGQLRKFPETETFLKWLACDFRYNNQKNYKNPYELRIAALDGKVSDHEFGRALYHLVQRRGYRNIGVPFFVEDGSKYESTEKDKETKTQLERRERDGFKEAMDKHGVLSKALKNEFLDKGKRARNQYTLRGEYQHEFEQICEKQGYDISKGENSYNDPFIQSLWKAIIWQRPLKSQKGNIGKCTLETSRLRCPASHPVFEIFRAFSFINTIKYVSSGGEKEPIAQELRDALFEGVFLKKDKNFKFEDIRKFLDIKIGSKKQYNYPVNEKGEYDTSVSGMPITKGLISIFGDEVKKAVYTLEQYNIGTAPKIIHGKYSIYDLWHILFDFDEAYLKKYAVNSLKVENKKNKKEEVFNPFAKLKQSVQSGYADLSLKAMCKIIPFLKDGHLYNEAVVLAKIPELLGEEWETQKEEISQAFQTAKNAYADHKTIINITNKLIEQWKAEKELWDNGEGQVKAWKDYTYELDHYDEEDILKTCEGYFGEKSWEDLKDRQKITESVEEEYQAFYKDQKRTYRQVPTLSDLFKEELTKIGITTKDGDLYHHSVKENRYLKKYLNTKTGEFELPEDTKTGLSLLPEATTDSIKNPMFNKAMSMLRKVINELIKSEKIDEDTEVTIEVARELNDNNKRAAIERYQREREKKREKYRKFLEEFKEKEDRKDINVENSLDEFELWTEQIFEETTDEEGKPIQQREAILKEKSDIDRYELWIEQKGLCMYTGNTISIAQLFSNKIDIEHTIPRSILPDNTMANRTVAYAHYNRDEKGKNLPRHLYNFDKEITHRLDHWRKERDKWRKERDKCLFKSHTKAKGNEDEGAKNKRIQKKHYFKMHYDYWADKIARFEAKEVKDGWARRQLVDTQMVSKYAREFLKSYFKKVEVQKGEVTAIFRKIHGFQEEDEIKNRNKHTHHAIDAAVLTLIPANSSNRERMIKQYHKEEENKQPTQKKPFASFNPQTLIKDIESGTLIVNYTTDTILKQTVKNVRKRGRLQYLEKNGNKIQPKAKGDTIRSQLFKENYLGKIRNVKRDADGKLRREQGKWIFESGKNEFTFTKRVPVDGVKTNDIIDPKIKDIVANAKAENTIPIDAQGKTIRHVRIKASTGREVKKRLNYLSKHDYKNKFYSEAGSIPYAIMVEKEKKRLIPLPSFEIAKAAKDLNIRKWDEADIEKYLSKCPPKLSGYSGKRLLRVGQKVIVFKSDEEYHQKEDLAFQMNRMYYITQFHSDGRRIYLRYHLEARSRDEINKYPASIEVEGDTPLLLMSSKNWNFLYEGEDFEISLLGEIKFIKNH